MWNKMPDFSLFITVLGMKISSRNVVTSADGDQKVLATVRHQFYIWKQDRVRVWGIHVNIFGREILNFIFPCNLARWPHVRVVSPDVFASKYIWLFHKWWATFRGTVAYISIEPINLCLVCGVWMITQKRTAGLQCREISQTCTQGFIHPALGGEGWKTSQAAHIDYPLENVC